MAKLSPRHERFCQEYLRDLIGTQAAIRAGYSTKGASVIASNLLRNSKIQSRVAQLKDLQAKRLEVTADRVLKEYAKLAFLDIRKAFDADGNLKAISELDDDTAAAVAGIDFEEVFDRGKRAGVAIGRIHKIKLSDKKGALDSIAKHLGMFIDKTELTGKDGSAIDVNVMDAVAERVRLAKAKRAEEGSE